MSYDVYLEVDAGGPEPVEAAWFNHTSNTAIMWREAGCDIADFEGADAKAFSIALTRAIADIEERPDHYAKWNPPNGWGSVETTLDFLRKLRDACEAYPLAKVSVSR